MAPKSTDKKAAATKGSAPPSRRSARLTGGEPSHKPQEEGAKKRSATDKPTSVPASKKAKPTSKAAQPKSKPKAEGAGAISEKTEEEEKEAEAPANAEPDLDTPKDKKSGRVLKVGDKLPSIKLRDEEGAEVDVGSMAGEKGVVLFLYPKANTPGCTNQASGFRDAFDEISGLGYEVYGLSRDGPTAQKNWKTKQKLNYKLLCDPESLLIKRLGAFVLPKNTKRSHFIFEKGTGKLIEAKYGVKPADDPKDCLAFIKGHHK